MPRGVPNNRRNTRNTRTPQIPVATLDLKVTFDTMPDQQELVSVINSIDGAVEVANLSLNRPGTIDLLNTKQ